MAAGVPCAGRAITRIVSSRRTVETHNRPRQRRHHSAALIHPRIRRRQELLQRVASGHVPRRDCTYSGPDPRGYSILKKMQEIRPVPWLTPIGIQGVRGRKIFDCTAEVVQTPSRTVCYRIPRIWMRLCVLLRSAKLTAIGNNTLTIRTFFSPRHCRWNVIATQPIGLVSFQARGILPVAEEESRTRGSQSSGVEDQPQCRGMWHSSRPSARSLSRSPSPPPPSFTQSPSPPRSVVRDGQTSPHKPRLVVSRSTCPPLSPSPLANSFIIGTEVIITYARSSLQRFANNVFCTKTI
jgi:hypothetical protein